MKARIIGIIGVIVLIALVFFWIRLYFERSSYINQLSREKSRIETAYKKDVEILRLKISEKEKQISESEKRAGSLRKRLAAAEKKIKEIKKPFTSAETAQRMNALHYPTVLTALKDVICFSEDEAANMVVDLEKCRVIKDENTSLKGINFELEKQINNLNEVVEIKTVVVAKCEEMAKEKEKVCKEQIEAVEPSLFDTIIKSAGLIGAGALIGIIITLL